MFKINEKLVLRRYALVFALLVSSILVTAQKRPNIIFLMADDQSTYTMGCYGNKDVQTPNLDKLADKGVVFENHYATTAICMASRASVMTGMFEFKTGCNFEHGNMMSDTWQKSYPMLLRKAGYKTAFAGKFGFNLQQEPHGKKLKLPVNDFDQWAGAHGQSKYATNKNEYLAAYAEEYPHSTLAYGAFSSNFIKEASQGDQPFCLSISFKSPHKPATPDPRFDAVYKGKTFKKPDNFGRENGSHFAKQSQMDRQYDRFNSWGYADNYDKVMATYHQQVYGIDQAVGMILDALKETGADKNTIVVYTSDNGYLCGSHGYGSKVLPYEESSRIPLIIFDPREKNSGRKLRIDALTGNCDIAPTLLSLGMVDIPQNMDGINLMSIYKNPKSDGHAALPLINVWGNPATHYLSVVTKTQKYINWSYAAEGFEVSEELYNKSKDPMELSNLAHNPEQKETLSKMQKQYDELLNKWKNEVVPYNDYERFITIFDRAIAWDKKAPLINEAVKTKTK